MLVHKKCANIKIFSLIILVGILVFCEALVLSNLRISFSTFPLFTSSKWNVLFLLFFWIARMLGWFLYFKMGLKAESSMFLVTELFELKFWNFKLLYYIRKEIRILCFFTFRCEHLFIFSRAYFLSGYWLVREQRFYCFPKFLIIYNIFLIQILVIFFFNLFSRDTHIYSFVLHKACRFLLFSFLKRCFSASTFSLFLLRVLLLQKAFDCL